MNGVKFFVNFDFASRPFHSFTPLKEKHFWPHVVRKNGTRRSVSVFRSSRYWFLITCRAGKQGKREPHHLYIYIPFSKFFCNQIINCLPAQFPYNRKSRSVVRAIGYYSGSTML